MLKTSTGKIYTLLSACKPENAKVKKRLLITKILEMPEYKALQVYQGAASVMDDYYGPTKLQEASYEELGQIELIIPFLEDCIRKLYGMVCYGDVRTLKSIEKIAFYDANSMKNLYDMVKSVSHIGMNITNITEYDVWSVLSKDTVKSLDECGSLFDACDIDNLEIEITQKLNKRQYCISGAEIAERRKEYFDVYRKEETIKLRLQIVENKVFMKKLIISFFSAIFFTSEFSAGYASAHPIICGLFLILYLLALATYWIKG